MRSLVVVENPKRWPFDLAGAEVVRARDYLTESRYADMRRAAVYNLCRHLSYQSVGYYVSLLAAARGHRPLPSVGTSQALGNPALIRVAADELDEEIQRALAPLKSTDFVLSVYFGRNLARRHERLSRALFNIFPAPFLIARFTRGPDDWRLVNVRLGAGSDVPEAHRDFVIESAERFFSRPDAARRRSEVHGYDLAILWSADDPSPPSDEKAIRRFVRAAARAGIRADIIARDDYGRIAEYDALFIRETTYVNHHTYRFAARAAAEGLVVLDDPEAIVRTTNKVYQAEVFARHDIPAPPTHILHEVDVDELVARVGLPCVLKKPDGAFSQGVVKVETAEEAAERLGRLLDESELVVAQPFMPSDFDWRIGILDRRLLFACRYHMARGHWQIVSQRGTKPRYGKVEAVALDDVPDDVLDTGLRAAALFGDGLFGVDVKVIAGRPMVMEVNDNPNIDAGAEDALLKRALYDAVIGWFRTRLDRRRGLSP